jgi:sodium-dependent phosphate transporter
MAAVYGIWDTGIVEKKVDMPLWILGMGGVGIVLGLILYGYNIMQAIGFELTKLSPSRGFSIELGAALVVLTGSRLEIPLSTTHCQVGATVGVGLTEGVGNVNWWLFARVVFGWVITLLVASLVSAAIFSYAVYAPQN